MNRFKTYAFWLALSSAVVILVQSLGKLFGFEIESSTIENVIMSICGVLVVLGIVTKKSNSETSEEVEEEVNEPTQDIDNFAVDEIGETEIARNEYCVQNEDSKEGME